MIGTASVACSRSNPGRRSANRGATNSTGTSTGSPDGCRRASTHDSTVPSGSKCSPADKHSPTGSTAARPAPNTPANVPRVRCAAASHSRAANHSTVSPHADACAAAHVGP